MAQVASLTLLHNDDARPIIEAILAELKAVSKRDQAPELDEFAQKIEKLLAEDPAKLDVATDEEVERMMDAAGVEQYEPESVEATMERPRFDRWNVMAKRWASSRIRWTRYRLSDPRSSEIGTFDPGR